MRFEGWSHSQSCVVRREPKYFEPHEINANFERFLQHAQDVDVPDVIGFADLAHQTERYVRALGRSLTGEDAQGACVAFPLPNGPSKLRTVAVLDPRGQIVLRLAAGRIASTTDGLLRRGVHSARLVSSPPGWETRRSSSAWKRLKKQGRTALSSKHARAVLRTDVASYYPTIDCNRLCELLDGMLCDRVAVGCVRRLLKSWQMHHGLLHGLPIGPEGSSILGTAFLCPIDDLFGAHALGYLRYTDDIYVVGGSDNDCWEFSVRIEARLADFELEQNSDKTNVVDAEEARASWFGHNPLGPYDETDHEGIALTEEGAVRIIREELTRGDPDANRFPYALGALKKPKNREPAIEILGSRQALEQFPKHVANYLIAVGPIADALVERTLDGLDEVPGDRTQARDLHLIRACRRERMGRVEGSVMVRAATDPRRPSPVRAWALDSAARTGCMCLGELGDIALNTSEDVLVRRAAVAATRNFSRSARRSLVSHRRFSGTSLYWAAAWASSRW